MKTTQLPQSDDCYAVEGLISVPQPGFIFYVELKLQLWQFGIIFESFVTRLVHFCHPVRPPLSFLGGPLSKGFSPFAVEEGGLCGGLRHLDVQWLCDW